MCERLTAKRTVYIEIGMPSALQYGAFHSKLDLKLSSR